MSTPNKIHGYLQQYGHFREHPASTFVGSGASFNAVSPRLTEALHSNVHEYSKPLIIHLRSGSRTVRPCRVVNLNFQLIGFHPYNSKPFVLDIREGNDILLGMPWLVETNRDID
ncbi:hypothetical protein PHMEG_00028852 [Phytophthora megakarya]|uniref:Reverse transcriptase n=1 Tax=Phytophthora megakarya TaxID=4795 RepID=A0A225V4N0_9STRA|nr:hypothetical protein PHMEG_00028852 [Phytophthora megakarya]